MRYVVAIPAILLVAGCVATVTPPRVEVVAPAPAVYVPPPPPAVVSVYVDPPISQPPPIAVGWAPPAMLVESPPPPPFPEAVWVGGYWVWHGDWVWAHGHWMGPPRPNYAWVHPYYEARDGVVIFIAGHWSAPGVAFVPPPPSLHLTVEVALPGVVAGPRPIGPNGCFVPPPPGSRPGFIVPAPIGTAPAVVTGAPPVVAVGMRITNSTTINNRTTNVTNITNVTNVTIVAPASATAGGKAFNSQVPARANLAAAQPSVVKAMAPEPASTKPIPSYRPGSKPTPLPPAQAVNTSGAAAHPAVAQNGRGAEQPNGPRGQGPNGGANKPAGGPQQGGPNAAARNSGPNPNGSNHGAGQANGAHANGEHGQPAMKHEEAPRSAGNEASSGKKPSQVAADKGGPKPRNEADKKPGGKKEQKKESKKEHEGEPGK